MTHPKSREEIERLRTKRQALIDEISDVDPVKHRLQVELNREINELLQQLYQQEAPDLKTVAEFEEWRAAQQAKLDGMNSSTSEGSHVSESISHSDESGTKTTSHAAGTSYSEISEDVIRTTANELAERIVSMDGTETASVPQLCRLIETGAYVAGLVSNDGSISLTDAVSILECSDQGKELYGTVRDRVPQQIKDGLDMIVAGSPIERRAVIEGAVNRLIDYSVRIPDEIKLSESLSRIVRLTRQ